MPIPTRRLISHILLAGTLFLAFSACTKTASQSVPTAQTEDKKQPTELPFEPDSKLAPTEPPKVEPPTYPPPTE